MFERLSHPLYPFCIGFLFALCLFFSKLSLWYIGISLLAAAIFFFLFSSKYDKKKSSAFIFICIFIFGSLIALGRIIILDRSFNVFSDNKIISFIGTVTDEITDESSKSFIIIKTQYLNINSSTHWQRQNYSFKIYCNHNFQIGDTILGVNLKIPKLNSSYAHYLHKEGLYSTLYASIFNLRLVNRPLCSFNRWLHTQKQMLVTNIIKKLKTTSTTLFLPLFLGYKHIHKKEYEKILPLFNQWGISHFLARSGLHLIIILLLWQYILYCIPLHLIYKELILLSITIIYSLISWMSCSFARSIAMSFIIRLCNIFHRQLDSIHSFILVLTLFLFYNPYYLLALDFQLSFSLTFALILFNQ